MEMGSNHEYRKMRFDPDFIAIRRLKNNEPVSEKDLHALEQILFSEDGPIPREEFRKLYGEDKPLGVLVRKITGLDQRAAKEAFAEFLAASPLTPDQMSFIDEIINYVVKNGTIEPEVLFETPFNNYNTKGVVGVFPKREKEIVDIISTINANADVA
jgi:type I restriction enzyme R subunit